MCISKKNYSAPNLENLQNFVFDRKCEFSSVYLRIVLKVFKYTK